MGVLKLFQTPWLRPWGLACLTLLAGPTGAESLPDTLERVRASIVPVGTFQPKRQPRGVFKGTGWAVADGRHIITNDHVVDGVLRQEEGETLAVFLRRKNAAPRVFEARKVACNKRVDLCVLRVKGVKLPALKLGHAADVREGEMHALTGFPIGMVLGAHPVTTQGIISAITPIAIPALGGQKLSTQLLGHLSQPFQVFQLDAIAYPGNSGSPLYEPDTGRVVGVINSVFVKESKENVLSKPSAITYAIPVSHVYDLLGKARLKP